VGIGIAAASTIAQVAMIASQSFADGGIISGPTVGLMGEYPGARSNPEVVAPLSKLQGMLSGGGGGGNFEVIETDIRGADIHLVLQRYNNTLTRSGK